jgi:hypothetical protein
MTDNLRLYPLPETIVAYLNRVDATAARMEQDGVPTPDVIGLTRRDFERVDVIVRHVSRNHANARSVTWNGRHLCAA